MSDPQNNPSQPVIEMSGVTVPSARRPNNVSVKNVNWRVAASDYWMIVGLEDSGKSDFLMMTAGLVPPLGGIYQLFGELMPIFEGERLATRLRLGLVFDDGRLFNHLTLAENVALPLQYHRNLSNEAAREAMMEILDLTELSPLAGTTPGRLGWNWQKRAALARAIVMRPDVLLLDDPLFGLDALHASWWLNFLDQLSAGCNFTQGQPMTLVVAAGALSPWRERARQFAVMKHGEFTILGSREQLPKSTTGLDEEFLSRAANI